MVQKAVSMEVVTLVTEERKFIIKKERFYSDTRMK